MSSLIAVLAPLLLVALIQAGPASRRAALALAPWAPLLLLWPWWAGVDLIMDWPLLGLRLGVDATSAPLILLTTIAWTLAGWQASSQVDKHQAWFWSGWLAALSGMGLLLLAGNLGSFYLGYAVLSLSAYLLVTHARSEAAWRAGRIYLGMALTGEAAILAGLLILAGQLGNAGFDELLASPEVLIDSPARWFLMAGFAVKLGIIPLHIWLPLAHPVAPVPASAILSGIIVKAGLLGWLRMVPALAIDPEILGQIFLIIGLVTAFGGVLLGLTQRRIKTVLAYSTISQMGLLLTAFSLLFLAPDQRDAGVALTGLIALHHGLNKAALFLACGNQPGQTRLRLLLFALPALSLAAAPLTTGYLVKTMLKDSLDEASTWTWLDPILALTSLATALLMWKAFNLARTMQRSRPSRLHPAWPTLVAIALIWPWWLAAGSDLVYPPGSYALFAALWPLAAATAIIVVHSLLFARFRPQLPEGDLVVILDILLRQRAPQLRLDQGAPGRRFRYIKPGPWLRRLESRQRHLPLAGLTMLVIGGLLWLLLWWPGWG